MNASDLASEDHTIPPARRARNTPSHVPPAPINDRIFVHSEACADADVHCFNAVIQLRTMVAGVDASAGTGAAMKNR